MTTTAKACTIAERLKRSQQRLADRTSSGLPAMKFAHKDRLKPFLLTEMEQAYWLGRSAYVEGGNVGIHGYFEVENDNLDIERFTDAWRKLIARHDMLRAVVTTDTGEQQVLEYPPEFNIPVLDVSKLDPIDAKAKLLAIRTEMSHKVFDLTKWPWFDVRLSLLPGGHVRIHMGIDGWCLDGWSYQIMFRDLGYFYAKSRKLPEVSILFRDYVNTLTEFKKSSSYLRDLEYWRCRITNLFPAPELPVVTPQQIGHSVFNRLEYKLEADATVLLREKCRRRNITLTSCLLTAFGEVLALWAAFQKFTLTIPRFDRLEFHPDVYEIVGQFSSFTLFEFDCSTCAPFSARVQATQSRLWEDLQHDKVSGVRVLREVAKNVGSTGTPLYPIVFTTAPERVVNGERTTPALSLSTLGEPIYSLTQTPQVKLDCQYLEQNNGLILLWDSLDSYFPSGMIDSMFEVFSSAIRCLAENPEAWDMHDLVRLPADQAERHRQANDTIHPIPEEDLYTLFVRQAETTPDAVAVITEDEQISYRELAKRVYALAAKLIDIGVMPGDRVAIFQKKGWRQVVSVFSTLSVGAAYVPLDVNMPIKRLETILHDCDATILLTAKDSPEAPRGDGLPESLVADQSSIITPDNKFSLPKREQSSLSYLIYTSGSTGTPKGVMVNDRSVVNMLHDTNQRFGVGPGDRIFNVTGLHHDLSVFDIFGGLCGGATLVLPGPDDERNAVNWLKCVCAEGVTIWNSVPAMMSMLLAVAEEGDGIGNTLRLVILGGDWVPVTMPVRLREQAPNAQVITIGGPTETTVWNIFHTVTPDDDHRTNIPYGMPAGNSGYYIRDTLGRERPDYAVGEMLCSGAGVAIGYWNGPERTAQSFFEDSMSGQRVYATGDLGYWGPDGEIHFAGRKDGQVKINGMRVETAEIEAVLSRIPQVAEAAVITDEYQKIVAFIRLEKREIQSVDVTEFLFEETAKFLPSHMRPNRFAFLSSMPLTSNGKVDRHALALQANAHSTAQPLVSEQKEMNSLMVEISAMWLEFAGFTPNSPDDNFFSLGGDSLQAIRLSLGLHKKINPDFAADAVFQYPTLGSQAAAITITNTSEPNALNSKTCIPALHTNGEAPMSDAQQRLWLLDKLTPGEAIYNLPFIIRLEGQLNVQALKRALIAVFDKHILLRSRFVPDKDDAGANLALIESWELPFTVEKTTSYDNLDMIATVEANTIFDLTKGPLVKLRLVIHGETSNTLFLTFHHIIFDGWSIGLFLIDMSQAYGQACKNESISLPSLPITYADYAIWLNESINKTTRKKGIEYWASTLAGLKPLTLPIDRQRPERQSHAGDIAKFSIPSALAMCVGEVAKQNGATAHQVLLSAFALTLGAISGQKDIPIGVPVAGRTVPDVEQVVGFYVNTLVIRLDLSRVNDGLALIEQTHKIMTNAQRWQDVPFASVVEAIAPPRDLSRNPLFQVSFDVQDSHLKALSLANIEAKFMEPPIRTTHTDLDLTLFGNTSSGYEGYLTFATALFDPRTADNLLKRYCSILERLVDNPKNNIVSLQSITNREVLWLNNLAGPKIPQFGSSLNSVIFKQVRKNPEANAIVFEDKTWTRKQLWQRSGIIAELLKSKGVRVGSRVALYLPRSLDWVASILAIHRVGACVAMIDTTTPQHRKTLLMEMIDPLFVLNSSSIQKEKETVKEDVDVEDDINREAFIAFTSGSTGRPKGVILTHKNILNRLAWGNSLWPFGDKDLVCQKTSQMFVDVIAETFAPLVSGVLLEIVPEHVSMSPDALLRVLGRSEATRLTVVPTVLSVLLDVGLSRKTVPNLRLIMCSGERLSASLIALTRERLPDTRIWNVYGSTEVSADVAACDVTNVAVEPVAIGTVVANSQIRIVNDNEQIVPIGTPGRMVVEGDAVAYGCIGADNNEFISTKYGASFDTGDLGRWRSDGLLEYLGRADNQVKIRGVRTEPAETEAALNCLDNVLSCAVTGLKDSSGEIALCAFVVVSVSKEISSTQLCMMLRSRLPEAFIPTRWALVDSLPLSTSGKVDWIKFEDMVTTEKYKNIKPLSPTEKRLAKLWISLGVINDVYQYTDFFTSGGNSLSAARLSTRIEEEWKITFSLADIFANSILRLMAAEISHRLVVNNLQPDDKSIVEKGMI